MLSYSFRELLESLLCGWWCSFCSLFYSNSAFAYKYSTIIFEWDWLCGIGGGVGLKLETLSSGLLAGCVLCLCVPVSVYVSQLLRFLLDSLESLHEGYPSLKWSSNGRKTSGEWEKIKHYRAQRMVATCNLSFLFCSSSSSTITKNHSSFRHFAPHLIINKIPALKLVGITHTATPAPRERKAIADIFQYWKLKLYNFQLAKLESFSTLLFFQLHLSNDGAA